VKRRELLAGFGGVAVAAAGMRARAGLEPAAASGSVAHPGSVAAPGPAAAAGWPRKADFDIADGYTYINAAYTHPIPKVALAAARAAAENRGSLHPAQPTEKHPDPRALFAALIGAQPSEIAYVPSTSFGENLVVQSLGLHAKFDGNVVTDGLHYEGALMHLLELKKKAPRSPAQPSAGTSCSTWESPAASTPPEAELASRQTSASSTGASGVTYHYSAVILALGSVTTYFGIEGLDTYAYGIKSASEIKRLKRHLVSEFMRPETLAH